MHKKDIVEGKKKEDYLYLCGAFEKQRCSSNLFHKYVENTLSSKTKTMMETFLLTFLSTFSLFLIFLGKNYMYWSEDLWENGEQYQRNKWEIS